MYSIGVDFHKAYSHMTVMDAQGQVVKVGKVPNTFEAVHAFVAPYRDDAQAVLEATRNWTVMYDMLERELRAVYLAHPLKVRAIAEARIKRDRIDSKILAHLLRCDLLPTAYVRPREQRVSQQILRQRMFLVRVRTMVKNRIHVLIDRQLDVREVAAQFSDLSFAKTPSGEQVVFQLWAGDNLRPVISKLLHGAEARGERRAWPRDRDSPRCWVPRGRATFDHRFRRDIGTFGQGASRSVAGRRRQEPRRVQNEGKLRRDVDKRGKERAEEAEGREPDAHNIDRKCAAEVLPDDPTGAPGECESLDEAGKVVPEQDDVRALTRDVRAGTHADTDRRRGERRRIVDAVANHGDLAARRNERIDALEFRRR